MPLLLLLLILRAFEELGVQRMVISSNTRDLDQMLPDMEMLAREVLPQL